MSIHTMGIKQQEADCNEPYCGATNIKMKKKKNKKKKKNQADETNN